MDTPGRGFYADRLIRIVSWVLIAFSILTVYMTTPRESGFAHNADEGYYFAYAMIVKEGGIGQFPALLQHHLSDKVAQLYPHPGRVGYVLFSAGWLSIFPDTFLSLARFSWLCFVMFLFASFWFSRKYFGERTACFYTVLLSVHPLLMTAGRRVLQDSVLNLFWALSVWLFLDFLIEKKRWQYFAFLAAFCVSLSIKEASGLLWIFFLAAFFVFKNKKGAERPLSGRDLAGIFFIPVIVLGALYVALLGGWHNVWALVRYVAGVHFPGCAVTNAYSLFGMGPWYKFIIDDLMLSPWTVLLAVGYLFHILVKRDTAKPVLYLAIFLVVVYGAMSLMKYTKIIRFVMTMEMSVCLFAVLALEEIFSRVKNGKGPLLAFLAVCIIYVVNSMNFTHLFVSWNIYDPISYWLLQAQRIIPSRSLF